MENKMKNENRTKTAYIACLGNIMFETDSNGNKISVTTARIPLALLEVDPRYQRVDNSSETKINKLAREWNDALCDPVRVVGHPEENCFYLIDGFHRFSAATINKRETLEAKIILFASDNAEERTKYEAKLFLQQGDNKEILKPVQMHKGRVLIGDKAAITLERVCAEYGVEIATSNVKRGIKKLCNYTKGYYTANRGEKCLRYVFDVIHISGFELESSGYSGPLFEVFNSFYTYYGDKVSAKEIGSYLRNMSIATFKANAIAKYPHMNKTQGVKAMIMYLQDYVVNILSLPAVLDKDGNKIISITERTA